MTEVTTILTAFSFLSGAAAPAVNDYVEAAKLIRANHDVRTLSVTLVRLMNDTAAQADIDKGWRHYDLLVGSGQVPGATTAEAAAWTVSGPRVGALDDHFIRNGAGYTAADAVGVPGWRGAYLEQSVGPDPWGRRYSVNVKAMKTSGADVIVLSAGPDGIVDSAFEVDGLPTAGDDIVSIVSSGRRGP